MALIIMGVLFTPKITYQLSHQSPIYLYIDAKINTGIKQGYGDYSDSDLILYVNGEQRPIIRNKIDSKARKIYELGPIDSNIDEIRIDIAPGYINTVSEFYNIYYKINDKLVGSANHNEINSYTIIGATKELASNKIIYNGVSNNTIVVFKANLETGIKEYSHIFLPIYEYFNKNSNLIVFLLLVFTLASQVNAPKSLDEDETKKKLINQGDRLYFLDGIRGWAALIVVMNHLTQILFYKASPFFENIYIKFFSDGQLAVMIFFLISGFSLSYGYFSKPTSLNLRKMVIQRYPRLVIPAITAGLLSYLILYFDLYRNKVVATLLGGDKKSYDWFNVKPFFADFLSSVGFNSFFIIGTVSPYDPILWTMSYEFIGSLFIFGIIALFKINKRIIIYPLLVYVFMIINPLINAMIFGIILCDIYISNDKIFIGKLFTFISLALLFFTYSSLISFYNENLLSIIVLKIALSIFIIYLILYSKFLKEFFSNRFSKWLGSISFSMYLVHLLVLGSFSSWLFLLLASNNFNLDISAYITILLSILVVFITSVLFSPIDTYAIKIARKFSHWLT
jgi:peptidoglycan/LPS O-acetylase OafA/YrhL